MSNLPIIKGRGFSENPKNRFEKLELSPDLDELDYDLAHDGLEKPKTVFYKDTSKSFITYNDSPDIGYNASVNPYRGCEHGCAYCLDGHTLILMANGTTKALKDIAVGDEIYGTVKEGHYRKYTKTKVLAHWQTYKESYQITLEDGTQIIASGDHRFLTERGWKYVSDTKPIQRTHLTTNNQLLGTGRFANQPCKDVEYKKGYLCGIIRGDGLLAFYSYPSQRGRNLEQQHQFRLALIDTEALERSQDNLTEFGISTNYKPFQKPSPTTKELWAIKTNSKENVNNIRRLIAWPEILKSSWLKGFLAGIFDAEGSYSQGILRISNTDADILEYIQKALASFDFRFRVETPKRVNQKPIYVIRLLGGLRESLRFFHTVDPAILRKRDIQGQAIKNNSCLKVVKIKTLKKVQAMFDITTGTGDFIANGVVSHNCYARPTHEYLGFSAGLDFETKIMVKVDAPELLRKELSHKNWKPQMVGFSGVTDIYQPIERKLELTRRCLEVFLDFRNPVGMVTKNHLILRDLDLLEELAKFDCVSVCISITTLDEKLRCVMEPRTSTIANRLQAVRQLANAGIHVGVLTAPIIPGLTDEEIPDLVQAATDAGAKFVGYSIVHLPYGAKDIFASWIAQHFPERADKVLNRIRDMRGGKLNDPRFGLRMSGEGIFAEQIKSLYKIACKKAGLQPSEYRLSTEHFRVPGKMVQGGLFGE
jgi:DNA repair photolyase